MHAVVVYTKDYCGYSARAKDLLRAKGVAFHEIDVTHDRARELEMIELSGRRTVPQIFIRGVHIGGHDDLAALAASGALDRLLAQAGIQPTASKRPGCGSQVAIQAP